MILFLEDWDKPENSGAIPDLNTSNTTFLRYSQLLKTMGVKNHLFPLALHNPNLVNIDPWSDNLRADEIIQIATECRLNPWYYFREILRVPPVAGVEDVPLRANRGNVALFWLFFNHVTTMLIQPRQTGKSLSTDGLMSYLLEIGTVNSKILLLTKDDDLRANNIIRLKSILDGLPRYLDLRTRKDVNNTEHITVKELGNSYKAMVPQTSEKAAAKLGRGHTVPIIHIDEIAYINYLSTTLPALLAAAGAARDSAREANAPYGNIFTTTPGYLSSASGEYSKTKIYDTSLRWTEKLYDCKDEEDLYATIMKNNPSRRAQILVEFNHRQLGYTDEWLRERIASAMADPIAAQADFLNKWIEGNESSPIDKKYLRRIIDSGRDEDYAEITTHGYIIRWYIPEAEIDDGIPDRMLIVGLDTSDAVGNDDIAMCIRDAETGEVVAAGEYNETNLIVFAEWLADLLIEYENMILVPERKSSGVAMIDYLLQILPAKGIDPFERIFNWVVNDADVNAKYRDHVVDVPFRNRDPDVYVKYRNEFGYATSSSGRAARDNLYGLAFNASVKYTATTVRDKHLITQLTKLVRKNNRIDHRQGEHDDLVISWLLPYWFLTQAKNKTFYGLSNSQVLASVANAIVEEEGGIEAVQHKQEQTMLRKEIEDLLAELQEEKNPYKSTMLTAKIKRLYDEIDIDVRNTFDIETLIESIEAEKRKKARALYY